MNKRFGVYFQQEDDGRWIADVIQVPGALAYGSTIREAFDKALKIAEEVTAKIE